MEDRKAKNALIFSDTKELFTTDQALNQAIKKSLQGQIFIAENDIVKTPLINNKKIPSDCLRKESLEAVMPYARMGKKFVF